VHYCAPNTPRRHRRTVRWSSAAGRSERPGGDRFAHRPDCLFKGADGSKVGRSVSSYVPSLLTSSRRHRFVPEDAQGAFYASGNAAQREVTVWDHIVHRDLGDASSSRPTESRRYLFSLYELLPLIFFSGALDEVLCATLRTAY